jgi:hypothetical protein
MLHDMDLRIQFQSYTPDDELVSPSNLYVVCVAFWLYGTEGQLYPYDVTTHQKSGHNNSKQATRSC